MKNKLAVLFIVVIIAITFIPTTAHAYSPKVFFLGDTWMYGTFDFEAQGVGIFDTIIITQEAQHVRLLGNSSKTYRCVTISVESHGNTNFILENVNITCNPPADAPEDQENTTPIIVHGTNNIMEIRGTNNLYAPYDVAIQVETGDAITIKGSGSLKAEAGHISPLAGAGIGGRYSKSCGTINIEGGNITALCGSPAAGIGGGGGKFYPIVAGGNGGNVNISDNAVVYATSIGPGCNNANDGTLNISGNAAVFFKYDESTNYPKYNISSNHNFTVGGYTFGYSPGGEPGSSITIKSLYALTYDPNGGTGSKSANVPQESTITLDSGSSFMRDGYTLIGWANEPDGIKDYDLSASFTMPVSNKTLYAVWTPYDITYNLDGGTNHSSNPNTYTTGDTPITLQAPVKSNYRFIGWYDSADFSTANNVTEIPSGAQGTKEYWAKWNKQPELKSGVALSASKTVTVNTTYSLDLSNIFQDEENDTLTYKVSVNGGAYSNTNQSYSYSPTSVGNTTLVFWASDSFGDASSSYTLTIISVAKPTSTKSKKTKSPTSTPSPTIAPSPSSTSVATPTSVPNEQVTTKPPIVTATPPIYIQTEVIEAKDGKVVIKIDVNSLPEGAIAVKLPNGHIVSLDSAKDGKIIVDVFEGWVNDDGSVTLIAIDDEQIALGSYNISVSNPTANAQSGRAIPFWLWGVIGVLIIVWAAVIIGRKKVPAGGRRR